VGDRTSVGALRAEIDASPQAQLLVLRNPTTRALRGSVWLEPRSATVWYLGSLTVAPPEQNSGLGRRILDAAERRLAELGATKVVIDVLNGYQLTGESHAFPYEDQRYGVPQRPDLVFLCLEKDLGATCPCTPNRRER
jgi:predicted N-acetyltransferase YhbS